MTKPAKPAQISVQKHSMPDGRTLRLVRVPRQQVEACETGPLAAELRTWVESKSAAQMSFQSLLLSIQGYDDDPRELCDVPEVCRYFETLTSLLPWWVHLPENGFGTMALWLFSTANKFSPTKSLGARFMLHADPQAMVEELFKSMNAAAALYLDRGYTETEMDKACTALSTTIIEGAEAIKARRAPWSSEALQAIVSDVAEDREAPSGLLDLALAQTGRTVDVNCVQFLTEEAFARGAKILITGFSHGLAKNKAEGGDTPESPVTTGYAQEDGSLHLRVEMPGRLTEHATFERGTWRELSKAEYAKLSSGALEKMQSLHGGTDEITHELANTMMKIADKMTARANLWKGKLHEFTQAITVFSKEPTALEFIKKNVPANFGVSQIVETWLQGDDAFLVLSTGRTQSEVWAMTATDIDDLVSKVLPEIAVDLVRDMSSTVLIPAALSDNDRARTLQQWQALGGRAP